jgi:hypothetical protein
MDDRSTHPNAAPAAPTAASTAAPLRERRSPAVLRGGDVAAARTPLWASVRSTGRCVPTSVERVSTRVVMGGWGGYTSVDVVRDLGSGCGSAERQTAHLREQPQQHSDAGGS